LEEEVVSGEDVAGEEAGEAFVVVLDGLEVFLCLEGEDADAVVFVDGGGNTPNAIGEGVGSWF